MSTEAKPGDSPTTEELRETLMAAVEVARAGQKEKPPVEPPARLKQLLAFRKFPERALGQVREVVEADEEFRTRVVEALEESEVSRVGWLWLARPEGWEQERLALSEEAEREAELATEAQRLVDLEQGLHRAEAAQKKAERQRDKADRERDQAKSEAIQARADAHHAEEAAGELESQRDQAHAKLEAAEKNLERVQRREARTEAKLKNARTQIDRLNKELRDSRQQHDEEAGSLKQRLATAEERLAMAQDAGFELPLEDEPVFVPPPPPTHRTPAPLPPGLLKDTVDAAEHLFRTVPELVVLIDGYNVAFKSWTDLPVREQRVRLMQKLGELSSRYSGPSSWWCTTAPPPTTTTSPPPPARWG